MPKIVVSSGKRTLQILSSEYRKLDEVSDLARSIKDASDIAQVKTAADSADSAVQKLLAELPARPAK